MSERTFEIYKFRMSTVTVPGSHGSAYGTQYTPLFKKRIQYSQGRFCGPGKAGNPHHHGGRNPKAVFPVKR
jgi:hypothetical protein